MPKRKTKVKRRTKEVMEVSTKNVEDEEIENEEIIEPEIIETKKKIDHGFHDLVHDEKTGSWGYKNRYLVLELVSREGGNAFWRHLKEGKVLKEIKDFALEVFNKNGNEIIVEDRENLSFQEVYRCSND